MKAKLTFVLAILLLLSGWAVLPAPAAAQDGTAPAVQFIECPFSVFGRTVECGILTVPENRANPAGRQITLPFAIVRSNNPAAAPDPFVYLSGGPGGPAFGATPLLAEAFAPYLDQRDLIVYDQRGVGDANPRLNCPEYSAALQEISDQDLPAETVVAIEANALVQCRNRHVAEGVDVAQYTSAASAADLNDLRVALGYEQWNLVGISYGTRLALTTMRDFPQGIRSVVLDSSYPLQIALYESLPANIDRAYSTLLQGCAAQPDCAAAFPDLENRYYAMLERLNAEPVTLEVLDFNNFEVDRVRVDGNFMAGLVFQLMYDRSIIPILPQVLDATDRGNYLPLAALLTLLGGGGGGEGGVSTAMYYSVQCSEEVPFSTPEGVQASIAQFPRIESYLRANLDLTPTLFALCDQWGVAPPNPIENEPVPSDIPTLVLAGTYDPITPPDWGWQAAQTVGTPYFYQFANESHGISVRGGCPAEITASFLNNPTAEPNAACLAGVAPPSFVAVPFTADMEAADLGIDTTYLEMMPWAPNPFR